MKILQEVIIIQNLKNTNKTPNKNSNSSNKEETGNRIRNVKKYSLPLRSASVPIIFRGRKSS